MNHDPNVQQTIPKFVPSDHPILIIVRGVPGGGKSYLARALQTALGKEHVAIVDPDATDYTSQEYAAMSESLTEQGVDKKFHPYRFVRAQAYTGISSNKVVIWNQGFTNLDGFTKTIVNLQTYAKEHDTTLPVLVVEVEIDEATAKERVAARAASGGHDVSTEAFARFFGDYKSFVDEGHPTVIVQGQDDVSTSVNAVLKALSQL